jgi:hypothetical protein
LRNSGSSIFCKKFCRSQTCGLVYFEQSKNKVFKLGLTFPVPGDVACEQSQKSFGFWSVSLYDRPARTPPRTVRRSVVLSNSTAPREIFAARYFRRALPPSIKVRQKIYLCKNAHINSIFFTVYINN